MTALRGVRWWIALVLAVVFYLGMFVVPAVMDVLFGVSHQGA